MIKLLWFITKFALAIALAVWLANEPGKLTLTWHGYMVEASAAVLCLGIFLLIAACLGAYRLVRLLRDGPRGMKLRRQSHQQQLGLQRLEQGFSALAAGDAAEAGKMALTARKLLGDTALTHWLQAQAAQLAGDHAHASRIFTQLTQHKATAILGYRGLIGAALRQNNPAQAAALVKDLGQSHPNAPWLQVAQYEVATRQGAWAQAAQALQRASKQNLLEGSDKATREAALLLAQARQARTGGNPAQALQFAEQAQKTAPDWLPARIELVESLLAGGYDKPTLKRIEKFWVTTPHPKLGTLFLQALRDEAPLKRFKRVEQLCASAADHPASHSLLASAADAAGLSGEAQRHWAQAAGRAPHRQNFLQQAESAEKAGAPAAHVRDLLRQAATAAPEPHWHCQQCGHTAPHWDITCTHCGSSMSIRWFDAHEKTTPAGALLGKNAGVGL